MITTPQIEYALELARRARQIALDGNHALAEQIREVMDAAFDKAEQDLP